MRAMGIVEHPSLQGYTALPASVSIYVPSTVGSVVTTSGEQTESVLLFFSRLFGGATATKAEGAYVMQDGTLVRESVTVVTARCTKQDLVCALPPVVRRAAELCEDMAQESVGLDIDGVFYLVTVPR